MYCYLLRYSTPQPIIDKTTELDSILGYTRCSYRLLIQFDVIYFIKLYSSFLSFFLFSLTISLIYSTLFTNAITQLRSNFRREMGFLVFPASTFFSISLHFFVSFFPFRFFLCAMIAQNVCVWALFIGGNKRPRRPCVRAAAAACTDGGEEVAEEEREREKNKETEGRKERRKNREREREREKGRKNENTECTWQAPRSLVITQSSTPR